MHYVSKDPIQNLKVRVVLTRLSVQKARAQVNTGQVRLCVNIQTCVSSGGGDTAGATGAWLQTRKLWGGRLHGWANTYVRMCRDCQAVHPGCRLREVDMTQRSWPLCSSSKCSFSSSNSSK